MAKAQSFGDKVRKRRGTVRKMVWLVVAEKKPNGQYRYREVMVAEKDVDAQLKAIAAMR